MPAVDARSPVDEADDMALFETPAGRDVNRHYRRVTAANRSSPADVDRGLVRRKRSEESEFDNVGGLDVDEERLARVRSFVNNYRSVKRTVIPGAALP